MSDSEGVVEFSIDENNIGAGTFVHSLGKNATTKVKTLSLDNFIMQNKIEKVDFIKADIEGTERLMLKGAENTL